jgi:hypothetical protein
MEANKLKNTDGNLLETPSNMHTDSVVRQFVACECTHGIILRQMLILGTARFSKAKGRFGDELFWQ